MRLRGCKPVRKGWLAPTLLIDALLNPDLVRPLWPQVQMTADVQVETPHQNVRQVIDRAYAKSRLEPLDDERAAADPEEARRRVRNLREARAILFRFARQHRDGRVLAVAQKGVREALEALGPLPRNLVLAHHNAVAGRDEWGDVSGLVVIGRTAPPPQDVERMAEALTGVAVPPIAGWYPRTTTVREMDGGEDMAAEADAHPDPVCEAIRWHATEGELVQIIGRGRGVNRTAAAPLDVLAMTDAPLPVPVHEAIGFADLDPTEADRMLAETGLAFETPRHAAFACPALWQTWEGAKKAMERDEAKKGKKGTNPYKNILIGDCPLLPPELRRVDYRRTGQGQCDAVAWFDPLMVADAEERLTYFLGKLARCQVAPEPPQPRPPSIRLVASADPPAPPPVPMPRPDPQPPSSGAVHMPKPAKPVVRVSPENLPPALEPVEGVFTLRRWGKPTFTVIETPTALRVAELEEVPAEAAEVALDPPAPALGKLRLMELPAIRAARMRAAAAQSPALPASSVPVGVHGTSPPG